MPPVFFGNGLDGVCNRRIVLKQVDTFIKMRRYESLSLHEVCKGLKVCFAIRGLHWVGRRY
jgi:telomerase reverse transcriptase